MIKIIKPGTLKEAVCNKCGAVLSYDEKEDLKTETLTTFTGIMSQGNKYIICPQCQNKIIIKSVR